MLSEIGDDSLIVGTDYGHRDDTAEIDALKRMATDGNLPKATADKILRTNPGKLYAIA